MKRLLRIITPFFFSSPCWGLFIDGQGSYALRGEMSTAPGMHETSGLHQATRHNFRFFGELRLNDRSSFFSELRLTPASQKSFLGDSSAAESCTEDSCKSQDTLNPAYTPYAPQATQAYIRYASEYCILEAGRRSRHWGLGAYLNKGIDPFDVSQSLFDGMTCHVNIQKSQTLGFSLGVDKLSETDHHLDTTLGPKPGTTNPKDDINQFFLQIEYDDRVPKAGSGTTKNVGIYLANIKAPRTELYMLDVYLGLYTSALSFQSEALLRSGKSSDPTSFYTTGGIQIDAEHTRNTMDAIAMTSQLSYVLSSSGIQTPAGAWRTGSTQQHKIFLEATYVPGDGQGYFQSLSSKQTADLSDADKGLLEENIGPTNRKNHAKGVAFHENFRPTFILFNSRDPYDDRHVSGIYHPDKVMNTTMLSAGYDFSHLDYGEFVGKVTWAQLNENVPEKVKTYWTADSTSNELERPIGLYGPDLGTEVSLQWTYSMTPEATLSAAAAHLFTGKAWKTLPTQDPINNSLAQASIAFRF
ncbi:MAG: hypothetical protein AB8C84_04140 [Oligoflexales bacterium]